MCNAHGAFWSVVPPVCTCHCSCGQTVTMTTTVPLNVHAPEFKMEEGRTYMKIKGEWCEYRTTNG